MRGRPGGNTGSLSFSVLSDIDILKGLDGTVGKGVYQEVNEAYKNDKLVLYIYQDRLMTDFDMCVKNRYEPNDRLYATIHINHF